MTRKRYFSIILSVIMAFSAVTAFDLAFTQSSIIAYAAEISAPSVTASNASYKSVKLTWKKVKGATKYIVMRSAKKSSGYKAIKTVTKNTYTDAKATCGKTYYYKVTAVKDSTKKTSKPVKIKCTPAKVSGVKATSTACSDVTVSFKKVSGASGYDVSYCSDKAGKYKSVALINSTSYTHSIGVGNTGYYKVRAYRTVKGKKVYGAYSSVASATAMSHSYSEWITVSPSTCVAKGIQSSTCAICGDVQYQELPMAASHSYGSYTVEKSPTCGETGTKYTVCSICGDKHYEVMPATGEHSYSFTTTEATCTEDGEIKKSCKNCDKVVSTPIKAKGHSYSKITVAPTCTEQGYDKYTCSVCGNIYNDNFVSATGHYFNKYISNNNGTHDIFCSICGFAGTANEACEYKRETIKRSTCTETGTEKCTCNICGYSYIVDTPVSDNHINTTVIGKADATCTSTGYTGDTKCLDCGKIIEKGEIIPAEGHRYIKETINPTCTQKGYDKHTCSVCGYTCFDNYKNSLDHSYKTETVAPTCTERGYDKHVCKVCGYSFNDNFVPTIEHSYNKYQSNNNGTHDVLCGICGFVGTTNETCEYKYETIKQSTCIEKGIEKHICENCGYSFNVDIPKSNNHTNTTVIGKADATCTSTGYTGDTKCLDCGKIIEKGEIIPAEGHRYIKETINPTCTQKGYDKHTCSVCGDTYFDNYKNSLDHSYETETVAPTCTERGYDKHVCIACGYSFDDNFVPTIEHSYNKYTSNNNGTHNIICDICGIVDIANDPCEYKYEIEKTPTETNKGIGKYTCTKCGYSYTVDLPYIISCQHDEGTTTVNKISATCTEKGYTGDIRCNKCGMIIETGLEISADGHKYEKSTVTPTCTEKGYDKYTCKVCDNTYYDNFISATGHNYVTTDATCTESSHRECSVCGKVDSGYVSVPAIGHKYVTTDATCTEASHRECSVCDEVDTDYVSVPATGHKYVTTDATCTEASHRECSVCGKVDNDYASVPATGHKYVTTDATCTEASHRECSVCDEVDTDYVSVPATGHKYVTTDATCTEASHRECSVCGKVDNDYASVPATGHKYEKSTIAPTCTEKGYDRYTCSACGDTYISNYVNALGHSYETETVAQTCTEQGYDKHTCKICGNSYNDNFISATGHNYITTPETCTTDSYRNCTVCGEVDPDYTIIKAHHNYVTTDATCTTDSHRECSVCGVVDMDYTPIPAKGHNYVTTPETCTEPSHRECSVCGVVDMDYTPILAKGHAVSTNYVVKSVAEADSTEMTHLYFICPECNEEIETDTFCLDITGVTAESLAPYAGVAELSPSGHKITLTATKYIDNFEISGTAKDITISVDAFDDTEVKFCGLTITNETASTIDDCIRINDKCTETEPVLDANGNPTYDTEGNPITEKVVPTVSISAKDGTVNTLKVSAEGGNAIECSAKLEFKGHGVLNMETVSTAVDARAKLYIRNLTMNIKSSANRGIDTKIETKNEAGLIIDTDYANISFGANATVEINSADDGIRCKNMVFEALDTTSDDKDTILTIVSKIGDGIQLEGKKGLTMSQGTINITAGKKTLNNKSGITDLTGTAKINES